MKKLNVVIAFFGSVLLFACNKNNDDVAAKQNENKSDTASLPHFDESNTPALSWDQLPAELKDAPAAKTEEQINSTSQVSQANVACYSSTTASFGGWGGTAFWYAPPCGYSIYAIALRTGAYVDRLIVWYRTSSGFIIKGVDRGGSGGVYRLYYFAAGERIEFVYGRSGALVDYLAFYTNRKVFSGGGWGGAPFYVIAPYGRQILGFYGRSGVYLNRIGFYLYTI